MLAIVTRPSASSIWRSWRLADAAPRRASSRARSGRRPRACRSGWRRARRSTPPARPRRSSGVSAPNTVMLSAPTSANWARLNAVRIGMWRRSSSSTMPGPTIAASISSDGSARNSPATSGTSASDSDSALWRKLTWTTNTSAAANASASAHHGSRRSPPPAPRDGARPAQRGSPPWRPWRRSVPRLVRPSGGARGLAAPPSTPSGVRLYHLTPDHFTPFHFTPVQRRPVQRRPSRSRRRRTATE